MFFLKRKSICNLENMTTNRKIAILGCKDTTKFLLDAFRDAGFQIHCIITLNEELGRKNDVAGYLNIKEYALSLGIHVYEVKSYALKHADDIRLINDMEIDIAFVMGWQRLIPDSILSRLSIGAFGMHGSAMNLPLGRGRSPMNWSIIEGRKIFYTNLFKYDPGVDSGDVVDTFKFQITDRDTAQTMHFKNTLAMKYLVLKNIDNLLRNDFSLSRQSDTIIPTYYPKRTSADSIIDWNQDIYVLERFVRAVAPPFGGAFTFCNGNKVICYDVQVFDVHDFGYDNVAAGTIVEIFEGGKLLVKGYGGLLLINHYETSHALAKGMNFDNGNEFVKNFPRNPLGFFDIPE